MKHLLSILSALVWSISTAFAQVPVTLTVDEGVAKPAALSVAERNLGTVLGEINRAQKANEALANASLKMDQFAKRSLERLWANTHFYFDDTEFVERCWVFRNGTMMVSHIPLIITPEGDTFGMGTYQEAVVEFDKNGLITDFRLAMDAHMGESMEKGGDVVNREEEQIIWQQLEHLKTAYNQKDWQAIEAMFSEDALIITGKVVTRMTRSGDSNTMVASQVVEYNKQSREQYINNLRVAFRKNKWIDVKFSPISEMENPFTRSKVDPNKYGVRIHQSWKSSSYSDEGYLFLLFEFPKDGRDPIIHVRTWQPSIVGNVKVQPDDNISSLGAFSL